MAALAQHEALGGISCGICHNDHLQAVGELDICYHRCSLARGKSYIFKSILIQLGTERAGGHVSAARHMLAVLTAALTVHRFCFPCILQWSQIESRCPFCKARFARLVHRRLSPAAQRAPDPGLTHLDGKVVEVGGHLIRSTAWSTALRPELRLEVGKAMFWHMSLQMLWLESMD